MSNTSSSNGVVHPVLAYVEPIPGDRDGRTKGDALCHSGEYSPGKATVRRPGDPRKWDKRSGYGFSGATLVYHGDDLTDFEVDIYIWTELQSLEWDAFRTKWYSKPARPASITFNASGFVNVRQPKALGVVHPVLSRCGISAVVVSDVVFAGDDDYGGYLWIVSFTKWQAPLPMLGRPDGNIPGAKPQQPTAADKTEQDIQKMLVEIQKSNDNLAKGIK